MKNVINKTQIYLCFLTLQGSFCPANDYYHSPCGNSLGFRSRTKPPGRSRRNARGQYARSRVGLYALYIDPAVSGVARIRRLTKTNYFVLLPGTTNRKYKPPFNGGTYRCAIPNFIMYIFLWSSLICAFVVIF